jgi:membrane protein implicated in regulation of membrane protease activity
MDFFNNAAVIWFIVGFALFVLEFAVPGLVLFFFGLGAWITGIVLLLTDTGFNGQIAIFLASSVIFLLLFRKWVKKILWSRKEASEIEDEFVGRTGVAVTPIGPGKGGKVDFKGTVWDARSDEAIAEGEQVIITGNDSIILIVKPAKSSL